MSNIRDRQVTGPGFNLKIVISGIDRYITRPGLNLTFAGNSLVISGIDTRHVTRPGLNSAPSAQIFTENINFSLLQLDAYLIEGEPYSIIASLKKIKDD